MLFNEIVLTEEQFHYEKKLAERQLDLVESFLFVNRCLVETLFEDVLPSQINQYQLVNIDHFETENKGLLHHLMLGPYKSLGGIIVNVNDRREATFQEYVHFLSKLLSKINTEEERQALLRIVDGELASLNAYATKNGAGVFVGSDIWSFVKNQVIGVEAFRMVFQKLLPVIGGSLTSVFAIGSLLAGYFSAPRTRKYRIDVLIQTLTNFREVVVKMKLAPRKGQ